MMNYCTSCELADTCELADQVNFCDDCKDCNSCPIKFETCDAGHYIECNNGFEDKNDYCSTDGEDDENDEFDYDGGY